MKITQSHIGLLFGNPVTLHQVEDGRWYLQSEYAAPRSEASYNTRLEEITEAQAQSLIRQAAPSQPGPTLCGEVVDILSTLQIIQELVESTAYDQVEPLYVAVTLEKLRRLQADIERQIEKAKS